MASYFNVSAVCLLVVLVFVVPSAFADEFSQAKDNAALVNEGFNRCQRYVDAWLNPWPKTFSNLRASRETELADKFPEHVLLRGLVILLMSPGSIICG